MYFVKWLISWYISCVIYYLSSRSALLLFKTILKNSESYKIILKKRSIWFIYKLPKRLLVFSYLFPARYWFAMTMRHSKIAVISFIKFSTTVNKVAFIAVQYTMWCGTQKSTMTKRNCFYYCWTKSGDRLTGGKMYSWRCSCFLCTPTRNPFPLQLIRGKRLIISSF